MKTILWTINDMVHERSRKGVKLSWKQATPSAGGGVLGFRIYRSTSPSMGFCALLRDEPQFPVMYYPGVIDGICASTDAEEGDFTAGPSATFFHDHSVIQGQTYYYRVTQLELDTLSNIIETPINETEVVAGQELPYEPGVLPPPQGLKAWAPESGPDMHRVYLRWCHLPEPSDFPPPQEYRVYRQGGTVPFALLARLHPSCLDPTSRCEITNQNKCISEQNCPDLINPSGSCSGSSCAIVDTTFSCWPHRVMSMGEQGLYNFSYVVTAMGASPQSESMHSNQNEAWLNYCGWEPDGETPGSGNPCVFDGCFSRRDPDASGEYFVCGDENARRMPDTQQEDDRGMALLAEVFDPESSTSSGSEAPYRVIGQAPDIPYRFVFFHTDHLGSPRVTLGMDGSRIALHHYLPFGEERPSQVDHTLSTKAFTGHERDSETGLDYMLARYYASSLARFMSPDKGKDIQAENPQSWNAYTYVANNPLRFTDPTGEVKFATPEAEKKYQEAKAHLQKSKAGKKLIKKLEGLKGKKEPTLALNNDGKVEFDRGNNQINWDPSVGLETGGQFGTPGAGGVTVQSPAMVLAHEADHAVQFNTNPVQYERDATPGSDAQYDTREERRVITGSESSIARDLGEPTRSRHGDPYTNSMYRTTVIDGVAGHRTYKDVCPCP